MLAKLFYWISSSTTMRFATTLHFPWQYFNTKAKSCVLYFLQLFSIDAQFVNKFLESHEAGSFSWTDHKMVGISDCSLKHGIVWSSFTTHLEQFRWSIWIILTEVHGNSIPNLKCTVFMRVLFLDNYFSLSFGWTTVHFFCGTFANFSKD